MDSKSKLRRMHARYPIRLWQTDMDEEMHERSFPVCPDCGQRACPPYCESGQPCQTNL
jgi:hypothetical protein